MDLRASWTPPGAEGPLEELPIFHDRDHGVVGIGSERDGWSLQPLAERGGRPPPLGSFRVETEPPQLGASARAALAGYLRYVAERDATIWTVLEDASPRSTLPELEVRTGADLLAIASTVVARAALRAAAAGGDPRHLKEEELLDGVRATDAECLDRPTLGAVL